MGIVSQKDVIDIGHCDVLLFCYGLRVETHSTDPEFCSSMKSYDAQWSVGVC
jgi:hypothetical protein